MSDTSSSPDPLTAFGPNEWLVDEMFQQYKQDKNSVDRAWWDFFRDYEPGEAALGRNAAAAARSAATPARRATGTNGAAAGRGAS
ncbi:MAG TPA: hypothetical protein VES95_07505, partial [Dermatophilaceae bacterium]|nr:hypothetical protein [Dermatophilaceae bacterium]